MQKELTRANAAGPHAPGPRAPRIIKKLNAMRTELGENQKGLVGELKQVLRAAGGRRAALRAEKYVLTRNLFVQIPLARFLRAGPLAIDPVSAESR